MIIGKIKIYRIKLPFSMEFSHSLRKRFSTDNIVVEVVGENGEIAGYGEGAPRSYVTGESQRSALEAVGYFIRQKTFPWELNDVNQIWKLIDSLPRGKGYNAAICALEMSLLDAIAKKEKRPVTDYFSKDFYAPKIHYGGVVPLAHKKRVKELCVLTKKMEINKLRLKIGKDFEQNREMFETVKSVFGNDCDLRVDVNGAWDHKCGIKHVPLLQNYGVKVVEQPFMPHDKDISKFARFIKTRGLSLMADESACTLDDVEHILQEGLYEMVNIRLSKCGGFRNSIKMINYMRENGLSFQIGCQLGESGLLSSAGRSLSLLCSDALYYDGSYDKFLLKENITSEDVSFGLGGEAGPVKGIGLGVDINNGNLLHMSKDSPEELIRA